MLRRAFARVALVAVIVGVSLLPSVALSSSGAAAYPLVDTTLWTIEGVVQDPAGRPIELAAVTDGSQTVYTDADGRYVLEEEAIREYHVHVSKDGFNSESRVVHPWDPILHGPTNFTLTYEA